jgi:hypothetical protein
MNDIADDFIASCLVKSPMKPQVVDDKLIVSTDSFVDPKLLASSPKRSPLKKRRKQKKFKHSMYLAVQKPAKPYKVNLTQHYGT